MNCFHCGNAVDSLIHVLGCGKKGHEMTEEEANDLKTKLLIAAMDKAELQTQIAMLKHTLAEQRADFDKQRMKFIEYVNEVEAHLMSIYKIVGESQ